MSEIGVIHLIRAKNGIEPFKRFLASYAQNQGGIAHDLLIVYKGFTKKKSLDPYENLLEEIPHESLLIADFGYDIRAYLKAAKTFRHRYFCFLNSFTVLLDDNWLLKPYRHICRKDVGLVGATGSYESAWTNAKQNFNHDAHFPQRLVSYAWLGVLRARFDPFPNYHIRTNGFMMARDTMLKIRPGLILTKMDAHRFESGKESLTKQVLRMNLKALIIGKDGKGYEKEEWHQSNTFRQGNQDNLLIADNQTNTYLHAGPELKGILSRLAWGKSI